MENLKLIAVYFLLLATFGVAFPDYRETFGIVGAFSILVLATVFVARSMLANVLANQNQSQNEGEEQ